MDFSNWYTSIPLIAAAAVAVGGAIRTWLGDVGGWNRVPLVIYTIGLTLIGGIVSQTVMDVQLAATFGQLIVLLLTAAIGASGLVSVATNIGKPLGQTVSDAKVADARNDTASGRGRAGVFALVVLTSGLVATACATRGGQAVSPEGTLAVRGNQFVQALRTVITPAGASPIEQLVASKAITAQDALAVAKGIEQTMQYAQDLAATLAVIDNAKTSAERDSGLVKAAKLAQAAADGLARAQISVVTEAGRKAVVDVLRLASQALLLVGSIFPAPGPLASLEVTLGQRLALP